MKNFTRIMVALFWMARPKQVLAIGLVFCHGVLIARHGGGQLAFSTLVWALAAGLCVSLSVHYANEYADYETDQLAARTPYSGGSGVLPSGSVPRSLALQAAWVTLILGLIIQVAAVALGIHNGVSLFVLGLIAFLGWMYSLPPLALAWNGWGELDNALLGGMMMPVYGYSVVLGSVTWLPITATLPLTLLVFVNLLAVTWPDRAPDAQVGKNTLATRWQPSQLRTLYYVVAASVVILNIYYLLRGLLPTATVVAALTITPLIVWGASQYIRSKSPHPTVYAMVGMIASQVISWGLVAAGVL